jgi:hypothetical protein
MVKTIAEAWIEEGVAKGKLRGARDTLRIVLEDKFGPLPDAFVQQLEAVTDLARLLQAARQMLHVDKLEDLQL